jgi:hypothetical protein
MRDREAFRRRRASRGEDRPAPVRRQRADRDIAVPKDRDDAQMAGDIPSPTSRAEHDLPQLRAGWAEVLDCDDVFIGVNALDYSGYPTAGPEFIDSFQQTARLGPNERPFTVTRRWCTDQGADHPPRHRVGRRLLDDA